MYPNGVQTPNNESASRLCRHGRSSASMLICNFLYFYDRSQQDYVEVGTKTSVAVTATAWDERPGGGSGGVGCGEDGCLPELAHDGIGEEDVESRWSCAKTIVPDGGQCQIEFAFGSPQDIKDVVVDFWKGDERTRTLKVGAMNTTRFRFSSRRS